MEHSELVNKACRWLRNTLHCRVVLNELVAYTRSGETPDAIGWVHNRSILVECKTNISDFKQDRKKRSRFPGMPALGHWRFYLVPIGLLTESDLLEGWGFYEIHGKRILHGGGVKYANAKAPPFESDRDSEIAMLLSALSRIHNNPI